MTRGVQGREAFCQQVRSVSRRTPAPKTSLSSWRGRLSSRSSTRSARSGARRASRIACCARPSRHSWRQPNGPLSPLFSPERRLPPGARPGRGWWRRRTSPGFYDRPVSVLEPGMHTAPITRADVAATGAYAVTGAGRQDRPDLGGAHGPVAAHDPPAAGPGNVGKVYAVALKSGRDPGGGGRLD